MPEENEKRVFEEEGKPLQKRPSSRMLIENESKTVTGSVIPAEDAAAVALPPEAQAPTSDPSWTLQQYFDGEINLDAELSQRFKNVPVMTSAKFRILGDRKEHGVATLSAQDESSWVVVDVDQVSRVTHLTFTLGAMLSLRFSLKGINDIDRERWVTLMRREEGGLAFLWGPQRWEHDYIICIKRKYFTNLFAFSPGRFEAAVRMTPDATEKLVDWLEAFWQTDMPADDEPPPILTW
jgi:hypothetical protein